MTIFFSISYLAADKEFRFTSLSRGSMYYLFFPSIHENTRKIFMLSMANIEKLLHFILLQSKGKKL